MALWNMIVHAHTRSVSKRLFSRMVTLYDHHHFPEKMIEVKPDEDTVRRVANAFRKPGQEEKMLEQKLGKKKVHLEVEIGVFQIVNKDTSTPPLSITWDLLLLPIILLHS
ncbi:hypothetical protein HN51_050912 [Arachis hypogaea]